MNEFDKQPWIADARALLEASAQGLDAATLARLNRARQAALAQQDAPRPRWFVWLPAGLAFSCALLMSVTLWSPRSHTDPGAAAGPHATMATGGDAEAAAADDGIEFYQNLEFYAWLDAQDPEIDG